METEFYADEAHPWVKNYRLPVVYNSAYLIPSYAVVLVISDEWESLDADCLVTEEEAQILGCYIDYLICDDIDPLHVLERMLHPLDIKNDFNTLFVSKRSSGHWCYYRKTPHFNDYTGDYVSLVGMLNFIETDTLTNDIKASWKTWKSTWKIAG